MIPMAFVPLVTHLWQSTLFAAVAGLLTLALKRNQARVRYWLWLAASCKFLLPFSWLVSIGHRFEWSTAPAVMAPAVSALTEAVSGPIFLSSLPAAKPTPDRLPVLLFAIWAIWACGFAAVVAGWTREWLRIRAIVRTASPLPLGLPIRSVSTPARLEPGVFGILRPVLLLPEGIASRLTKAQLQAVLAHELCHVRRRDNLTAMIHMLVEAIFWFYPLLWWLGARMIDERERACDEEVLQSGSHAQAYAESILKVCEFYLESPLTCMSGVTGSDLKKRIQRIMQEHLAVALSARKKLLLATAAIAALAVPIVVGVLAESGLRAQAPTPTTATGQLKFDVASIKRNNSGSGIMGGPPNLPGGRYSETNLPLKQIILFAYQHPRGGLEPHRLIAGPEWSRLLAEHFDIEAKAEGNPPRAQTLLMMQSLLADRFKLVIHHETRKLPIYALVVAKRGKTGPQLTPHSADAKCLDRNATVPDPVPDPGSPLVAFCGGISTIIPKWPAFRVAGNKITMDTLAGQLSTFADRQVVDRTGLSGSYDFSLEFAVTFTPGDFTSGLMGLVAADETTRDPSGPPSLFTAVQEQLGLKLVPQTGPVDVIVIDHVEEPSPN